MSLRLTRVRARRDWQRDQIARRFSGRAGTLLQMASQHAAALPSYLRRPAIFAAVSSAVAFGVMAGRYAGGYEAGRLDRRVETVLYAVDPDKHRTLSLIITMGNPVPVVTAALTLGGIGLVLGRRRLAALMILGPGLTGVATTTVQPLVGRTIYGRYVFPSGHEGAATALGLVTTLLLINLLHQDARLSIALLIAGTLLTGGVMAVALIVGRFHYPTDVAGGFCAALAVVLGTALALERWADGRETV